MNKLPSKIYWSFLGPKGTGMLVSTPIRVLKDVVENPKTLEGSGYDEYKRCPAHIEYFKNTFAVKALMDVKLEYRVEGESSSIVMINRDQKWFEESVKYGALGDKYLVTQLNWDWHMFSEEDIEVSQIPASIHVNQFLNTTIGVSATMNISKWLRPIRPAFFMRKNTVVDIKRGDVLFYIKVHTKEPIELVQYDHTEELDKLSQDCIDLKFQTARVPLRKLYNYFTKSRYPNKVLKLIKANLR